MADSIWQFSDGVRYLLLSFHSAATWRPICRVAPRKGARLYSPTAKTHAVHLRFSKRLAIRFTDNRELSVKKIDFVTSSTWNDAKLKGYSAVLVNSRGIYAWNIRFWTNWYNLPFSVLRDRARSIPLGPAIGSSKSGWSCWFWRCRPDGPGESACSTWRSTWRRIRSLRLFGGVVVG